MCAAQRQGIQGGQRGQHDGALGHRACGLGIGHHAREHGGRCGQGDERQRYGGALRHVQPQQHPVHGKVGQGRLGNALHQHHGVVAEPAQRCAAPAFEQHDGHAQLQQKQADALQRPNRAAEARQPGHGAHERVANHLGQAHMALEQIAGERSNGQQQRPLHRGQSGRGAQPLRPEGKDFVHVIVSPRRSGVAQRGRSGNGHRRLRWQGRAVAGNLPRNLHAKHRPGCRTEGFVRHYGRTGQKNPMGALRRRERIAW